jgi:SDR family mycofactocin-dependent oxidoreductase
VGLLSDSVVFITGGARGQGRAHAVTSARQSADVVLFDVPQPLESLPYETASADDLETTAALVREEGQRVLTFTGDVRSQADLDAAVDGTISEFGTIDMLIANAGIVSMGTLWELPDVQWQEMIDVNLTGAWRTMKAVVPTMLERGKGSIVMTNSMNGLEPGGTYGHYTASKHGNLGLMKTMALELAPHGIRCSAICPAGIRTPMVENQAAWDVFAGHVGGTPEEFEDGGRGFHALKGVSWMDPQVIADAALFLNSHLASHITGIALPVDAGHLLLTGLNHAPSV